MDWLMDISYDGEFDEYFVEIEASNDSNAAL
jgi:hypothetical protein